MLKDSVYAGGGRYIVVKWKRTNQVSSGRRGEFKITQPLKAEVYKELEPAMFRRREIELAGRKGVRLKCSAP